MEERVVASWLHVFGPVWCVSHVRDALGSVNE